MDGQAIARNALTHTMFFHFGVIKSHAQAGAIGRHGAAILEVEVVMKDVVFVIKGADDVAGIIVRRDTTVSDAKLEHSGGTDAEFQIGTDRALDTLAQREVGDLFGRADATGFAD